MEDKSNYQKSHLETAPTVDSGGRRKWIYPDRRPGKKASWRMKLAIALIAFYLAAPWLSIQGLPLIRIDIQHTSFYFFGLALNFSDASYLFFLFVLALVTLFLVTTLKGRIWCGYACPQTVFVEWVIRPIEEWLEGPAHRRRIQDRGSWSTGLKLRKLVKHVLFFTVSVVVANTFLAYFYPVQEVMSWMLHSPAEHPGQFVSMAFVAFVFYFDLTWFREQFCSFLCPYARFQAVMVDDDTPTVIYNYNRGEPRGKKEGSGDCINCGLCVRVCPTGIDIRNGLQLECIQCLRCVDACAGIMQSLKRSPDLITQASPSALVGQKPRVLRPRVFLYVSVLLAVSLGFLYRLQTRADFSMSLIRQPGAAYTRLDSGEFGNMFTARLSNQSNEPLGFKFSVIEPSGGRIICAGCDAALEPLQRKNQPLLLIVPSGYLGETFRFKELTTGQEFSAPLILPAGR